MVIVIEKIQLALSLGEKHALPCSVSLRCAPHDKGFFAVRIKTHDKDFGHGKHRHECTVKIRFTATTEESVRQRKLHGKGPTQRTSNIGCTAKALGTLESTEDITMHAFAYCF
jgi:hypothetical protein